MAILDEAHRNGLGARPGAGPRSRSTLIAAGAAALVSFALVVSTFLFVQAYQDDELARQVDARVNALGVKPAGLAPTIDKAFQVRRAIVAGDFASAKQIIAAVFGASQLQYWRFYPYDDFIAYVLSNAPPEFADRLDEWVARDVSDAIPLLLRAQYSYDVGWAERGHGFVDSVSEGRMAAFADYMNAALADVSAAISLDPSIPNGFTLRLRILRGIGSREFFEAFSEGIATHPKYYPLYEVALATLQPRWGGSTSAMTAFVEEFAGGASQFSPLKFLYLNLYRDLLSSAGVNCRASGVGEDEISRCIGSFMNQAATQDLERKVVSALSLYDHTDKHQFDLVIREILADMLATPGGDAHAGAVLQLAATSMYSDTQLKRKNPGHNDYVIDELVAQSWERKGFRENAAAKYREALAAAQNATFPSEEEKNFALARIYSALADAAASEKQYVDQIAYAKAAVLLGVPWSAHRVCTGYYNLENYDRAIEACTNAIAMTDNPSAWFWRGASYDESGQQDAALADWTKVADRADENFAPSAVIRMSMIFFDRSDLEGALAVLNAYPFLYDPARTRASDVAVGYNNRCYAYMELGDLKKALEDCTQSLRYGSIPDAFRKQQELVARLNPSK